MTEKVSLIRGRKFPRAEYLGYPEIGVNPATGEWHAWIYSYAPVGWLWEGKVTTEYPEGAPPPPEYPPPPKRMFDAAAAAAANAAWRKACSAVYEAAPKPQHVLAEASGQAEAENAARFASQTWVLETIEQFRRVEG